MKTTLMILIGLWMSQVSAAQDPASVRNNNVGLLLMREIVNDQLSEQQEKNIITSPLSFYMALSMAYNGTNDGTYNQLAEYLGDSVGVEIFNMENKDFQSTTELVPASSDGKNPHSPLLGIYNSAWATTHPTPLGGFFIFSPDFVKTLQAYYNADVQTLDFLNDASADVINDWVSQKTDNFIPKILDASTLSKLTWVLLNATLVEANWRDTFASVPAEKAPPFHLLNSLTQPVPMINNTARMAYQQNKNFEAVEIPFYNSDLAFFIVQPTTMDIFSDWRTDKAWQPSFWNGLFAGLRQDKFPAKVNLTMPKLAFASSVSMFKNDSLTAAAGLKFLYEDDADFSMMSTNNSISTAVGLIKHDTRIVLDEFGVKAAAVTTIGGVETTSMPAKPAVTMTVDKPFFFAIGSKQTGTLIFVGMVVDPLLAE